MLKIGITGGIGSGKTTVCRLFEKLDIPVYYADLRAKYLMNHQKTIIQAIKAHFGDAAYKEGKLDRAYLANIVFKDKKKLEILNQVVHPAVFEDNMQWQQMQMEKAVPYTLKEAALLFETGSYQTFDKIIVVTAPLDLRIERVMQRDQCDSSAVQARIDKQMPQAEKEKKADFLIQNIHLETLAKKVQQVHQELFRLSSLKKA